MIPERYTQHVVQVTPARRHSHKLTSSLVHGKVPQRPHWINQLKTDLAADMSSVYMPDEGACRSDFFPHCDGSLTRRSEQWTLSTSILAAQGRSESQKLLFPYLHRLSIYWTFVRRAGHRSARSTHGPGGGTKRQG